MNELQWQEEQDAWFSRNDRFDGFDRGDIVTRCDWQPTEQELAQMAIDDDIPF